MQKITISGTPGSGKSTVAELLQDKLNLKYINSGMIFRQQAKEYNMSLEDFGRYCEENIDVDKELDRKQIEILKKNDNIVIEGRLSGWLAYKNNISVFKVMITADIDTRVNRIINREGGDISKRKKELIKREKSEKTRYKNYYDIDLDDTGIYDIVIDSSNKKPEEIVKIILNKIN